MALQRQLKAQWCTVAVASSIAAYRGLSVSQGQLACWCSGTCCGAGPASCMRSGPFDAWDALTQTSVEKLDHAPRDFPSIDAEIAGADPVVLDLDEPGSSFGHVVVITETIVADEASMVFVQDPSGLAGSGSYHAWDLLGFAAPYMGRYSVVRALHTR